METRGDLKVARRIVIKIGSALLVDDASGQIRHDWLEALADDVARLRSRRQDVLLVSSGAISVGRRHLGLIGGSLKLEEKQAAAACGQIRLAHAYQEVLARHKITIAQILLSPSDTEERRRHLNARATLQTLLNLEAVPVVNENDTVTTQEIRFGDNDRLAARVAQMVSADCLILLSDIDGLYTGDPRAQHHTRHIPEVALVTPEIEAMAGAPPPGYSSGGMVTKIAAAKIALGAGCRMAIADGRGLAPLKSLEEGALATWFIPSTSAPTSRKQWIAGSLIAIGAVMIDEGAQSALVRGSSLLPAGVIGVEGGFERGDPVLIKDRMGRVLGKGIAAYDAADAVRIINKTNEIRSLLGYRGRDEMIRRDDLALEQLD
ncbi:MAG: glutamate 5-kinase [Alphaproteobacteria bacterium]